MHSADRDPAGHRCAGTDRRADLQYLYLFQDEEFDRAVFCHRRCDRASDFLRQRHPEAPGGQPDSGTCPREDAGGRENPGDGGPRLEIPGNRFRGRGRHGLCRRGLRQHVPAPRPDQVQPADEIFLLKDFRKLFNADKSKNKEKGHMV